MVLSFVLARVPLSALPRPPRWLQIALVVSAFVALTSGEAPEISLGPLTLGVGGFLDWLLLTVLLVEAFLAASLVGWTTHIGDLGKSVAVMARPLTKVGLPVESAVAATALGLRCLPLILDELRTMLAAWRNRSPLPETHRHRSNRERVREALVQAHDILMAALASALRRAQEMAQAMEARGGLDGLLPGRLEVGPGDWVALLAVVLATAVMLA
jgi:energy-coupling factor transporter transmembrane protein EcfT